MIRINLLPPIQRQSKWPLNRIFIATSCAVLLSVSAMYAYLAYSAWTLENKIIRMRNQYQALLPVQEQMRTTGAIQQTINSKNAILIQLTNERVSWYGIFSHLGMVAIPQVWLTDVSLADKTTLKLKGMALTYPDLAAFVQKLDPSPIFGEPVLLNAEKDTVTAATKFEMTVKIKGR